MSTEREYTETRVGCGKNLLKLPGNVTASGITYTLQADGTYLANGTCTGNHGITLFKGILPPGRRYVLSGGAGGIVIALAVFADNTWKENICVSSNGNSSIGEITSVENGEHHRVYIQPSSNLVGQTVSNVVLSPQLELGDTATDFEPYQDIPFLALDNAQGQIESVAVEAGCRTKQAGTGDPSPENIRAITGRESVEIAACGKNLVDLSGLYVSTSNVGMSVSGDNVRIYTTGDGGIWRGAHTPVFTIHAGVPYTLSATLDAYVSGNARIGLRGAENNTFLSGITLVFGSGAGSLSATFTPEADDEVYLSLLCTNSTVLTGDCTFSNIQLEIGSAATEYEPYRDLGGGTVAPTEPLYGLPGAEDTVEVSTDGDVLVTRRTAVLELDGTENWVRSPKNNQGYYYRLSVANIFQITTPVLPNIICSHYQTENPDAQWAGTDSCISQNNNANMRTEVMIYDANYAESDLATWKSYLAAQKTAGTPVTIVYRLAAPETEALTAISPIAPQPGRLNLYTDADALTATIRGSGWETVNDTSSIQDALANLDGDLASLINEVGLLNGEVGSIAQQIISPDGIKNIVFDSTEYQAMANTVEQNANELSVTQTTVTDINGRVETIEGTVTARPLLKESDICGENQIAGDEGCQIPEAAGAGRNVKNQQIQKLLPAGNGSGQVQSGTFRERDASG